MVLPLAQVAGTKLGKGNSSLMNNAQRTPLYKNYSPVNGGNSIKQAFNGPVAGYEDKKIERNEIEQIKDWQGVSESNKNQTEESFRQERRATIGNRLTPKKQVANQSVEVSENSQNNRRFTQVNNPQLNQVNASQNPKRATPRKKLGGVDYYGVLLFVAVKDVLDVLLELFSAVFTALVITGFLSGLIIGISTILDTFVLIITQLYFYFNDMPMTKKRWGIQGGTFSTETMPFVGLLPVGTISFVYMCYQENKERRLAEENEQKQLDEQFMMEQEENQKQMVVMMEQSRGIQNQNIEVSMKQEKGKEKNNDWQMMMDESNQNITKMNNTSTTPNKTV